MNDGQSLEMQIKSAAIEIGFSDCAITSAKLPQSAQKHLEEWTNKGRHGDMDWMLTRVQERSSPVNLWPDAKSVICLTTNYAPPEDLNPLSLIKDDGSSITSIYAARKDYHDVIKKRLKTLARWLVENHDCDVKVFVDTAPVMEKPLGQQSGLGWQGKHTNLVSRTDGSWTLLGSIFTTLDLKIDAQEDDHCGSCSKCLDICPTNAFPAPYQLDARKCLAYLSIEHKGPIPHIYREPMANRIFGCDDCLAVCPWNKFAIESADLKLSLKEPLYKANISELLRLTDTEFRQRYAGTPIKRTGRDRFIRNVTIAAGNAKFDPDIFDSLITLLDDASDLVRGSVIWAVAKHIQFSELKKLYEKYGKQETVPHVIEEWEIAMKESSNA